MKKTKKKQTKKPEQYSVCYLQGQVKMASVTGQSQERVSGEKRVAVKPLLNVQCPPMSLEKVWQAILRQFWRYVRPRVNPKDGFDFNEIL